MALQDDEYGCLSVSHGQQPDPDRQRALGAACQFLRIHGLTFAANEHTPDYLADLLLDWDRKAERRERVAGLEEAESLMLRHSMARVRMQR